jgi:hypothetical protein
MRAPGAPRRFAGQRGLRDERCSRVNSGKRLVHGGHATAVIPRQQHEVSVSDLPMPEDSMTGMSG